MAVLQNDRFFKSVAANTTDTQDYTVANGDVLRIGVAYGQAGMSPDTAVAVIWDEAGADTMLFCSHASGIDEYVDFTVTGDGTKKLTLKLINNQGTADLLGVGWRD